MYSAFRTGPGCSVYFQTACAGHKLYSKTTVILQQLEELIGIDTVKHLWILRCRQCLSEDEIDCQSYAINHPEDRGFIQLGLNEIL